MDTRPALTKLFEAFLKVQQYLECIPNAAVSVTLSTLSLAFASRP